MSHTAYVVKDGDKADYVARQGAVQMGEYIGFCELCDCYRHSRVWHTMRSHGTPYAACNRHLPLDIALWEAEQ